MFNLSQKGLYPGEMEDASPSKVAKVDERWTASMGWSTQKEDGVYLSGVKPIGLSAGYSSIAIHIFVDIWARCVG